MSWLKKLFGTGAKQPQPIRVELPGPGEHETVYGDQPLRKEWAESVLRAEGIPVNPHLPMIESEAETTLRTADEVANRLRALVAAGFKASESPDQALVDSIVAERGLRPLFTPEEAAFIDDPDPDEAARIRFSWRCEAAWVLLWALKHVDGQLGPPRDLCDVPFLAGTVYRDVDLASRGLRPANDILNEADLTYRCHWAVRQAALDGKPPPVGLHPGVTMERHHALNWLIGYNDGADWDEVTTDT
ncbi:MAG TPA: DUF4272 domain-containing protein [Allosphingosinicella sp.]|jgi:hypothetical protein